MKKSCENCRANYNNNGDPFCEIGFKTELVDKSFKGFTYSYLISMENCPKPTTLKNYLKCSDEFRENNYKKMIIENSKPINK